MSQATFTFRVDSELKEAFNKAAQSRDRSSAQLLRDFMRHYVRTQASQMTYDEWFTAKVEAGMRDAQEGRLITAEESKQRSLSREAIIRKAQGNNLEEKRQISAIEEGIREADAGNFATEEEVRAAFARWGADALRR